MGGFRCLEQFSPGQACQLCHHNTINEYMLGPIYKISNISLHYYCLLMATKVQQNGSDKQGLLGFFAKDIKKEVERGAKLLCVYCNKSGATVECADKKCDKTFHLPCGQAKGSIHQFFKEFKSFCARHKPVQGIPLSVRKGGKPIICTLCAERIVLRNSHKYLWPECCKAKTLFHRECIQKMACSAGYYHFRCPLCNNSQDFQKTMLKFGIYIPEREAAWEREPNAYSDLLDRYSSCDAEKCHCPKGRNFTKRLSGWEIELCDMCGGSGIHLHCSGIWDKMSGSYNVKWHCTICTNIILKDGNKQQNSSLRKGHEEESDSSTSLNHLEKEAELINISDSEDELVNVEDLSSDETPGVDIIKTEDSAPWWRSDQKKRRKSPRLCPNKRLRNSVLESSEKIPYVLRSLLPIFLCGILCLIFVERNFLQ